MSLLDRLNLYIPEEDDLIEDEPLEEDGSLEDWVDDEPASTTKTCKPCKAIKGDNNGK